MTGVFDKAKAARSFVEAVKAHDNASHPAALGEELIYLLLGGVERAAMSDAVRKMHRPTDSRHKAW